MEVTWNENDEDFRPYSPNTQWQGSTLESLAKQSIRAQRHPSRAGRLPTPGYKKRSVLVDPRAGSKLSEIQESDEEDEDDDDLESLDDGEEITAEAKQAMRLRRQSVRHLTKVTSSFMPDINIILMRLRAGQEGFDEAEVERFTAAFLRFKDPDGPEIQKEVLAELLNFLGFFTASEEKLREIADNISEYEALEKNDFMSFMESYVEFERNYQKDMFNAFDKDSNGCLDVQEIMAFLGSLGFTPLRSMVKEALELVDLDRSGTLDFEEVVLLMHVYRHSEGFTFEEITELTKVFQGVEKETNKRRGGPACLPADRLGDVLVRFFGPAQAARARELTLECAQIGKRHDKNPKGEESTSGPAGFGFQECLVWARCLRDKEFEAYREAFKTFDTDQSNSIDLKEVQDVVKTLGFTMTQKTLELVRREAFAKGDLNEIAGVKSVELLSHDELDFDSFVHFMQILQQTDGFSKEEMREIQATFEKFDEDGSGDIDVVELSDMLRYMGHSTKLDEVRRLHSKVDFNGSGALDMREFIRFMRLHRESEMERIRAVFTEYKDPVLDVVPADNVQHVMKKLGVVEDDVDIKPFLTGEALDFDGFIIVCDHIRDVRVAANRKRAGFSDAELEAFQVLFDNHDTKKTGVLSTEETTKILMLIGFKVRTAEEQKELKEQLSKARANAAAAGVEGSHENAPVNFFVLVQLLRGLYRRYDQESEAHLMKVAEEASFNTSEVSEFQEIFQTCWERENILENPTAIMAKKWLSRTSLYKLMRTMGLRLDPATKAKLDERVMDISGGDTVDFGGFLLLMRWMMDTNFGNINSNAEKTAAAIAAENANTNANAGAAVAA